MELCRAAVVLVVVVVGYCSRGCMGQAVYATMTNNMVTLECDVTIEEHGNGVGHQVLDTAGGSMTTMLGANPDDAWNGKEWGYTVQRDYTDPNSPIATFDPTDGRDPHLPTTDYINGPTITDYDWEAEFEGFFLTITYSDGTSSIRESMFNWY